jgi:hypothetical protein
MPTSHAVTDAPTELLKSLGFNLELIRVIVHAIKNEGGSVDSLRWLLRDPAYAKKLAIEILGDIAKMVDVPLDVDNVDWKTSQYELQSSMADVAAISHGMKDKGYGWFADKPQPDEPCRYKLVLPRTEVHPREVIALYDCAGYRELMAFTRKYLLNVDIRKDYNIVAAGSPELIGSEPNSSERFTIPRLILLENGRRDLSWFGAFDNETRREKLPYGTLYLVRC